jgi:hypothetical protein
LGWLPDSANITGKSTILNTEVRKLFTIFALFGISTLKDMDTLKWRHETDCSLIARNGRPGVAVLFPNNWELLTRKI